MNGPLRMLTPALWSPTHAQQSATQLQAFMLRASAACGQSFEDYASLHAWTIRDPGAFWSLLWDDARVVGERGARALVNATQMPGAQFFPDAQLNYAENLLRQRGSEDALVFWGEDRVQRRYSHDQLYALVSRMTQALHAQGVQRGDRVVGYLPNLPEALAAMLATSALGAVWSSCSPDFGAQGVVDRFGQIEPKVLFCADYHLESGRRVSTLDRVAAFLPQLPTVQRVVVLPYAGLDDAATAADTRPTNAVTLTAWLSEFKPAEIHFVRVGFNDPLCVLYSSGTTGIPKCIVHGVGGTLLQHIKEHRLHADVKPNDRLFYFSTLGWMMWNWLVSGLASGATLLLYDGSPFVDRGRVLFSLADTERMTHFGTSAKYIDAIAKLRLKPRETHHLSTLRAMFSTGSPLSPEGFDYVYRDIKSDLNLASISGGTDIVSCFVLGNPLLPVYRGEIQCAGLGMAVAVFDPEGQVLPTGKGELVCTVPFPSMPIGFWNDPDGSRYHAAYFARFADVWCHGDWCEHTERGGYVIHGRSDAVLNPGGVRIGTAEIYRQVEQLDAVLESLVIGQAWPIAAPTDVRVVLFVKLRDGLVLDDNLVKQIKLHIRANTTPRHVPERIVQVTDIPRTKSGKIVELAVRDVVHGRSVKNKEALANPQALELFRDLPELQR